MMNKTRSPKWYGLKNSMILISMAVVVVFTATFETKVIAQNPATKPLVVVDGKKTDKLLESLNPEEIKQVNVIKDKNIAVKKYGIEAANGVIEIIMKDTLDNDPESPSVSKSEKEKAVVGYASNPSVSKSEEITVVGYASKDDMKNALIIVDGEKASYNEISKYSPKAVTVLKGEQAVKLYGEEGKNGVIIISTKDRGEIVIRDQKTLREPLYVVNGEIVTNEEGKKLKPEGISSIAVLKGDLAINKYGALASNGVVEITMKDQSNRELEYSLTIAPNPGSDVVSITLNGVQSVGKLDVKVYDRYGKIVLQDKKSGPTFTMPVSGLIAGSYIVNVSDGTNVYKGIMVVGQ